MTLKMGKANSIIRGHTDVLLARRAGVRNTQGTLPTVGKSEGGYRMAGK